MRIDSFQPNQLLTPEIPRNVDTITSGRGDMFGEFGQVMGRELSRVNEQLVEADRQAQGVATGQAKDLHEAMLAMAQADLALQVTMRVTQKAIAAYQEISRMQI